MWPRTGAQARKRVNHHADAHSDKALARKSHFRRTGPEHLVLLK